MLLRPAPEITYRNTVTPFVVVRGGVQGHVEVANKVNDVAQGIGALVRVGVLVFQNRKLLCNSLCDAAASPQYGANGPRAAPRGMSM